MDNHYMALIPAYAVATGIWFVSRRWLPQLWGLTREVTFKRPALEFSFAVLAGLAVLGVGQLYLHDLLLPGSRHPLLEALNQFLIFSPVVLLLFLRRQSPATVWLPADHIPYRLTAGVLLALISLLTYAMISREDPGPGPLVAEIMQVKHVPDLVQVFMEDLTIALLFVRLSVWVGRQWALVLVAVLFAAGHLPALIAQGSSWEETASLLLDTGIGVLVLSAVSASQDIWWFFIVHFVMDMTQFSGK